MALTDKEFDIRHTYIDCDYKNNNARNQFLADAISELVEVDPVIIDSGYIEHERCLTIKSVDAELCIRPDAGIAHGWGLFGRNNSECSDEDIRDNWETDLQLYNKKQNFSGILYTISFNKLK